MDEESLDGKKDGNSLKMTKTLDGYSNAIDLA